MSGKLHRPDGDAGIPVAAGARVYIIRHAQSTANAGGRTADAGTIPITGTGRRQAECVADLIPTRPHVIAVSSFLRTLQTAEPLLRRFPGVRVEQWPIEEFTYLDTIVYRGTTYAERQTGRDGYWKRCDPLWVDGPGCECFADFLGRVRSLEQRLISRTADKTVVVFTHGFVIRALLWLQQQAAAESAGGDGMARFDIFAQSISVPNCGVVSGATDGSGRLRLSSGVGAEHLPEELRTE